MSDWVILTTAGRQTLPLEESLSDMRFEVWTPKVEDRPDKLRCRVRHIPFKSLVPRFVFARECHVDQLQTMEHVETGPFPQFSIMRRADGGIPLIADRSLDGFRDYEKQERFAHLRTAPPEKTYQRGEKVNLVVGAFGGSFDGMTGIVEKTKGKFVVVMFDKEVTVDRFLLVDARQAA